MSKDGRILQIGDVAKTDYNGSWSVVSIIDRDDTRKRGYSHGGILFRVNPVLRNGTAQTWYDADWFVPKASDQQK